MWTDSKYSKEIQNKIYGITLATKEKNTGIYIKGKNVKVSKDLLLVINRPMWIPREFDAL